MKYRYDLGLEFLQYCSNEELEYFINVFKEKGGFSAEIFNENRFKKYYPNHKKYWDLIAAEIQFYGGNTILNKLQGHGVLYKDILIDICEKGLIVVDKNADVATIEKLLIFEILKKELNSLTHNELKEFEQKFNLTGIEEIDFFISLKRKVFGNDDFFENITTELVGNLKNMSKVVFKNISLQLSKRFFVISNIYDVLNKITGPAYRVLLPIVIYIAYLREKYKDKDSNFRKLYKPKIGSILRTELVGNIVEHSGIYIDDGKVVEIFNDNGIAIVKEVSLYEFVYGSGIRTGKTIYIAIDKLTKEIIYDEKIAKEAKKHIGKTTKYELLNNNCHSFVHKCIIKEDFEKEVSIWKFEDLTKSISENLNNDRIMEWVVCDVNPQEYKINKNWSIEQEVV